MTAPLTDYTTYDDVRGALGVAAEEIEDTTLALSLYKDQLEVELEEIAVALPSTYQTKKALPSPSEAEARFLQAARLFATYAVARHLTTVLPMFAPKDITDGKAGTVRMNNPYKETIDGINKQYGRFRTRLDAQYAEVASATAASTTPKRYFSVVSPATDVITGA